MNVDDEQELAVRYGVQSIPAVKLFRGGELVAEATGAMPRPQFEAWLAENGA